MTKKTPHAIKILAQAYITIVILAATPTNPLFAQALTEDDFLKSVAPLDLERKYLVVEWEDQWISGKDITYKVERETNHNGKWVTKVTNYKLDFYIDKVSSSTAFYNYRVTPENDTKYPNRISFPKGNSLKKYWPVKKTNDCSSDENIRILHGHNQPYGGFISGDQNYPESATTVLHEGTDINGSYDKDWENHSNNWVGEGQCVVAPFGGIVTKVDYIFTLTYVEYQFHIRTAGDPSNPSKLVPAVIFGHLQDPNPAYLPKSEGDWEEEIKGNKIHSFYYPNKMIEAGERIGHILKTHSKWEEPSEDLSS